MSSPLGVRQPPYPLLRSGSLPPAGGFLAAVRRLPSSVCRPRSGSYHLAGPCLLRSLRWSTGGGPTISPGQPGGWWCRPMPAPSFSEVWRPRPRERCWPSFPASAMPRSLPRTSSFSSRRWRCSRPGRRCLSNTSLRTSGPWRAEPMPGTGSARTSRGRWSWHRPVRCHSGSAHRRSSRSPRRRARKSVSTGSSATWPRRVITGPTGSRRAARWRCGVGSSTCSPHRARNRSGSSCGETRWTRSESSPSPVSGRSSLRPVWLPTRPASSAPRGR